MVEGGGLTLLSTPSTDAVFNYTTFVKYGAEEKVHTPISDPRGNQRISYTTSAWSQGEDLHPYLRP